jgi:chromate reductase
MRQIAILVGSLRKESINRKLAKAVTQLAPSNWSFIWPRIDDPPLYNQDDDPNPVAKRSARAGVEWPWRRIRYIR